MTYQEAMAYLNENGKIIGAERTKEADKVVSAYKFHYDTPGDPGGQALLTIAVEEYIKAREA